MEGYWGMTAVTRDLKGKVVAFVNRNTNHDASTEICATMVLSEDHYRFRLRSSY